MRDAPFVHPGQMPQRIDVNQPDYATQVTKALGLQQRVPGHLDARIGIDTQLEDFTKPEFAFLRRKNLWQARMQRAATVGNFNYVVLPAVAGMISVVTRITVNNQNASAEAVFIGLAIANPVMTNGVSSPRDGRLAGQTSASVIYSGTAVAPTLPLGRTYTLQPGTSIVLDCEYVLGLDLKNPGWALTLVDAVANQIIDVSIDWSERLMLPTEVKAG